MDHRFGLGQKLQIVTNGYDPEDFVNIRPYHFGHFAIVYTGALRPPKRVIGPLIAALQRLEEIVKDGKGRWYFHYYGPNENLVREEAMRFGMTERVVLHGSVPRAEALSAVRGAGVAVAITSVEDEVTTEDRGIVPGKIFEALGLGTPLLVIAPSASDVEDIAETTGLIRTFTGSDIEGMTSFLTQIMLGHALKPRHLEDYAWPNIAKKLDTVLRRVAVNAIHDKSEVSSW
jgi:glycosyltransferase involved in cell wall biosynthesis